MDVALTIAVEWNRLAEDTDTRNHEAVEVQAWFEWRVL